METNSLARHRVQALPALPSPDLRQGRTFPPDDEEVPGNRTRRTPPGLCNANWMCSSTTTTRCVPIGPSVDGHLSRPSRSDQGRTPVGRSRGRRLSSPSRQGRRLWNGDPALRRPNAPHRAQPLRRPACDVARGRAGRAGPQLIGPADAPPHLGSEPGLPTPGMTWSSTMSRDICLRCLATPHRGDDGTRTHDPLLANRVWMVAARRCQ